jgi:hypothetical protein
MSIRTTVKESLETMKQAATALVTSRRDQLVAEQAVDDTQVEQADAALQRQIDDARRVVEAQKEPERRLARLLADQHQARRMAGIRKAERQVALRATRSDELEALADRVAKEYKALNAAPALEIREYTDPLTSEITTWVPGAARRTALGAALLDASLFGRDERDSPDLDDAAIAARCRELTAGIDAALRVPMTEGPARRKPLFRVERGAPPVAVSRT